MPIIITPITNKSTLAAFYPSEEKTLRDMLVEASGKADPTDDELEAIFFSWIWDDTKIPSILANYSIDTEVVGFKKLLQSEVTPCFLADYSDYLTAFQDAAEFKRHAYGVTLNNARVWALKYGAMTRRIMPWDSATEGYLDEENIQREGSDNRTENETTGKTGTDNKTDTRNITRSGTNTSNASANSPQGKQRATSRFSIQPTITISIRRTLRDIKRPTQRIRQLQQTAQPQKRPKRINSSANTRPKRTARALLRAIMPRREQRIARFRTK